MVGRAAFALEGDFLAAMANLLVFECTEQESLRVASDASFRTDERV